jgi:hypothetical protein
MNTHLKFKSAIWALTATVVGLALFVWWPSAEDLSLYALFPLFGLLAFSLMWTHYIAGALRRFFDYPKEILSNHFKITSLVVLFLILAHPFILYLQLYLDGLGLPYQSIPIAYPGVMQRAGIYMGVIALVIFLSYELYRFFKDRPWWRYVEWANVGAMFLILWHGFTLGGELRQPWFQAIWVSYAVLLLSAVTYTEYSKRKDASHGREPLAK